MNGNMSIKTVVEPLALKYTIRLDRALTQPCDFQEEISTIRMTTPNDVIHILINSEGGSLSTMKAILSAMHQTEAHIITEIEGECCSALGPIFLSGHEYIVSDDAEFMAHDASYYYGGKQSNIKQYSDFQNKVVKKLFHKYYKNFLTDEEIDTCIEGKDFWMDSDEIMERLENRNSLMEEEIKDQPEEVTFEKEDLLGMTKEEIIEMLCGEETFEESPDPTVDKE